MQRLRVERQLLTRSGGQDYRPATGLGHTVLASLMKVEQVSQAVISGISAKSLHQKSHTHLENTKRTLVAHPNQTAQGQLQHHGALEGHKVPHVFQQEELWSVVITVTARGTKRPNFHAHFLKFSRLCSQATT